MFCINCEVWMMHAVRLLALMDFLHVFLKAGYRCLYSFVIYNKSIQTGSVLLAWKQSNVIPVHNVVSVAGVADLCDTL